MPIRSFQKADIRPLTEILHATGMFRPEEIDVAVELMEIVTDDSSEEDYMMNTAVDEAGTVQGYYCIGPTPMTEGTFDLYWIAVDPRIQRKGIGKQLLVHSEALMRSSGGRLVVVETSSQQKYEPTRLFYEGNGYGEEARIKGYYGAGDDLLIYTKHL